MEAIRGSANLNKFEANGPCDKALSLADARILIPMPGEIESLNAGIAAGILIFEVVRQRNISQKG